MHFSTLSFNLSSKTELINLCTPNNTFQILTPFFRRVLVHTSLWMGARNSLTELPSHEDFRSSLTEENVTEEEYARAHQVWNNFKIKDIKEYHDHFLSWDVLLLTDVCENYCKMAIDYYKLDMLHY